MQKLYATYSDTILYDMLCGPKQEAEQAFAELYNRYSQKIYAYCLRMVGDSHDAKDIFQETFIKFFESANSYPGLDKVLAFIFKIARNLCLNYKRHQKMNISIEDYDIYASNEQYEEKEMLKIVAMALELLDFESREVFILKQYHGLSYKEIANITGDNIPTLKNRVWRAKDRLKEILSPYLEDLSN